MVGGELVRCQVPERTVGPLFVVVLTPGFDLRAGVVEREELMHAAKLCPPDTIQPISCPFLPVLARDFPNFFAEPSGFDSLLGILLLDLC